MASTRSQRTAVTIGQGARSFGISLRGGSPVRSGPVGLPGGGTPGVQGGRSTVTTGGGGLAGDGLATGAGSTGGGGAAATSGEALGGGGALAAGASTGALGGGGASAEGGSGTGSSRASVTASLPWP